MNFLDYSEFCTFMKEVGKLRLSNTMGGGYSYDKLQLWDLLNNFRCYEIMSDISNKESAYGSPWNRVDQDELFHSIENLTGFNTYYYSKKSYDDCMRLARDSYENIYKKGILDYVDKKHSDLLIEQIAFGLSVKSEKEWHRYDIWVREPWYHKVSLFNDSHVCGDNMYFSDNVRL